MTVGVLRCATFRRDAGEATSESSGSHQESMGGIKFPACVRRLAGKRARLVKWRSVQQVEGAHDVSSSSDQSRSADDSQ